MPGFYVGSLRAASSKSSARKSWVPNRAPGDGEPSVAPDQSEGESSSQLEDPARPPEVRRTRDHADGTGKYVVVRGVELGMVEEVEGIRPHFNPHVFPDPEALANAHVRVYIPWTANDVPPGVSEYVDRAVIRRICEGRCCKPLVDCGIGQFTAANAVGTLLVAAKAVDRTRQGQIATNSVEVVRTAIRYDWGEWNSGTRLNDAGEPPAADNVIQNAMRGITKPSSQGKIVGEGSREIVGGVGYSQTVVCARVMRVLPGIGVLIMSPAGPCIHQL